MAREKQRFVNEILVGQWVREFMEERNCTFADLSRFSMNMVSESTFTKLAHNSYGKLKEHKARYICTIIGRNVEEAMLPEEPMQGQMSLSDLTKDLPHADPTLEILNGIRETLDAIYSLLNENIIRKGEKE